MTAVLGTDGRRCRTVRQQRKLRKPRPFRCARPDLTRKRESRDRYAMVMVRLQVTPRQASALPGLKQPESRSRRGLQGDGELVTSFDPRARYLMQRRPSSARCETSSPVVGSFIWLFLALSPGRGVRASAGPLCHAEVPPERKSSRRAKNQNSGVLTCRRSLQVQQAAQVVPSKSLRQIDSQSTVN